MCLSVFMPSAFWSAPKIKFYARPAIRVCWIRRKTSCSSNTEWFSTLTYFLLSLKYVSISWVVSHMPLPNVFSLNYPEEERQLWGRPIPPNLEVTMLYSTHLPITWTWSSEMFMVIIPTQKCKRNIPLHSTGTWIITSSPYIWTQKWVASYLLQA